MEDFKGKTIAITGSTGGLGRNIAIKLAQSGAELIFINRNKSKSQKLTDEIKNQISGCKISNIVCDFESFESVKNATEELKNYNIDILILNSGIYNVEIKKADSGYNNIFQVNFLYQYYMFRKLLENNTLKKVVAVGSIAYNYGRIIKEDIDYSTYTKQSKIYGNSKRFLMLSIIDYCNKNNIPYSIVHPGITLTNMTGHYPVLINWFIKAGISTIFPSAKKSARNIISAVSEDCKNNEWIGPKFFNLWGKPKKKAIKHITSEEISLAGKISQTCYEQLK